GGGRRRYVAEQKVEYKTSTIQAFYVPACVNAMCGPQKGGMGVTQAFIALLERAGVAVAIPEAIDSLCCGTPWTSKGMAKGHEVMQQRVRTVLFDATSGGKLPVIIDASSCTEGFIAMLEDTDITVLDSIAFTAAHLANQLTVAHPVDSVTIHPTCSSQHLALMP